MFRELVGPSVEPCILALSVCSERRDKIIHLLFSKLMELGLDTQRLQRRQELFVLGPQGLNL
jgi:hypothetical protein